MNPNELQVAINEQQNAPLQLAKHTRFYCAKDIAAGLAKNWGYTPTGVYAPIGGYIPPGSYAPTVIARIAFAIVDALIEEANRAP